MSSRIASSEGEYHIEVEAIDAEPGMRCPECGDTAPGNKLLIFSTVRGRKIRAHDGAFCCLPCHDRYYGLLPHSG